MSVPTLEASLSTTVGAANAFTVDAELTLNFGVLVLFGPSGAGKTLTLRAIAGLIRPRSGFLRVHGETLFDSTRRVNLPAHRRRIGYVPQQHGLFPFCSVRENVAFGLPRRERRGANARIDRLLEETGIAPLRDANPGSLSGGERQRVSLARALVVEPRLLLLDEPFASIDQEGRAQLRQSLREILRRRGMSAALVTHDPEEALALGDALVRFERGRTTVAGTPQELLRRGQPVTVSGVALGSARPLDGGRAALSLREAVVEGPSSLLNAPENGQVQLELRTRPRSTTEEPKSDE